MNLKTKRNPKITQEKKQKEILFKARIRVQGKKQIVKT